LDGSFKFLWSQKAKILNMKNVLNLFLSSPVMGTQRCRLIAGVASKRMSRRLRPLRGVSNYIERQIGESKSEESKPCWMAPPAPPKSSQGQVMNNARIHFFSILLALQYGAQPLISKRFIRFSFFILFYPSFFQFYTFLLDSRHGCYRRQLPNPWLPVF